MKNKKLNSYTRQIVILVSINLISIIISVVFLLNALKNMENDSVLINLTGRQRMLSQWIVKDLALKKLDESYFNKNVFAKNLNSFRKVHIGILKGDKDLGLNPISFEYLKMYKDLDDKFQSFNNILDENNKYNFKDLVSRQMKFLKIMDEFVYFCDNLNQKKIEEFKNLEVLLFGINFIVLILVIVFIFVPSIKEIEQSRTKLANTIFEQAHTLRHPLSNIMMSISLIDTSKMSEEDFESIKILEHEANTLNTLIQKNIDQLEK
ncbi:type IV pili methyl-accepting chemotaxis transducer N-terminal domain-containing protein [Candidatus Kapabacteria bacterium]|nr:type IV pili methyl-accepting chemotaxis transducer N-terminal domain-containing protein [Candidatus Kapabacteria bacterium]